MKPTDPPAALVWTAPLRLVNGLNVREHWAVRAARTKQQRQVAELLTSKALWDHPICPPYAVIVTRLGKRRMDPHNLGGASKAVIDGIADALGVDDGDESQVRFYCYQEIGKEFGVRVEIKSIPLPSDDLLANDSAENDTSSGETVDFASASKLGGKNGRIADENLFG